MNHIGCSTRKNLKRPSDFPGPFCKLKTEPSSQFKCPRVQGFQIHKVWLDPLSTLDHNLNTLNQDV
jgi:hypothetical protein